MVLAAVIWIVATSGGRDLFVKEVLGEAFDSQAEHFLRGDVGVDLDPIRPEAIVVDGKIRMYFGPFPALVRIPLNFVYPTGRGMWSRLSGFCAATLALWSFSALVGHSLRASPVRPRARAWLTGVSMVGFVFATPLLYLVGSLSIFNEAIIWGLAWSMAALFFVARACDSDGNYLTSSILGFSCCAAAALLSRVTFGLPLLLIALVLACRVRRTGWLRFAALAAPLGAAVCVYLLLSYARFGNFTGMRYDAYINSTHREFVREHGMFNVTRVPCSFADYFVWRMPSFHTHPPFVEVYRRPLPYPKLFSLPITETFLSITWSSSWLVLGAIFGLVHLFHRNGSKWYWRCIAAALFVQVVCILSYFALAQRYVAELLPFLVFCFTMFFRNRGNWPQHATIMLLVVLSAGVNFLGTAFWLSNEGPLETRTFWSRVAGKPPPPEQ